MSNLFVSSTGSSTAPYDTWAKAATDFATAIAATSTGDRIVIDVTNPPADVGANTTWTFIANCSVVTSTNSGTATITPTPMSTSAWLGSSSASYSLTLTGNFNVSIYGITLRNAGSGNVSFAINAGAGGQFELEECYFWLGTTNGSGATIGFGATASNTRSTTKVTNCTYRFGHTSQGITIRGRTELIGGSISSAGSAPANLFAPSNGQNSDFPISGMDLSYVTGTLVANHTTTSPTYRFSQCKFGSGVTVLATQTAANKSGAAVRVSDCSASDVHIFFGYYDALGSSVSDTSIYFTTGSAGQSLRITTTANCGPFTPFCTPWVSAHNTGTSAITPRFEVARDGSTTAFQNDKLFAEFMAKTTSGSTMATLFTDRMAVAGTPANQATGAGTGAWTNLSGTAWSGKLDSGSSITPAEIGPISGRIVAADASITIYANFEILT